jgi:hypothetical protein
MTRRWRTWRVLLAVLLLGIAALAFWVWPPSPRWTAAVQLLRGFDERRQLVYLQARGALDRKGVPDLSSPVVLNVHDLTTGDFVTRTTCRPRGPGREMIMARGGDLLALASFETGIFEFFALPGGERLRPLRWEGTERLQATALSADSKCLAACTNEGYVVWDIRTGKVLHEHKVSLTRSGDGRAEVGHGAFQVTLSDDARLLAVTTRYNDVLVFDLATSKEIGCLGLSRGPVFAMDGSAVMVHDILGSTAIRMFRVANGEVQDKDIIAWVPERGEHVVGTSPEVSVTARQRHFHLTLRDMLPAEVTETVEGWLGNGRWELSIRDTLSGARTRTGMSIEPYTIPPARVALPMRLRIAATPSFWVTVLNKGQQVILQMRDNLELWDVRPGRSLVNWIACAGLAVIAIWIGWPRRIKVVPSSHAKA